MNNKVKNALYVFSGLLFVAGGAVVILISWKLFLGIILIMWADNIVRDVRDK
jgi:hypothetical protein